MGGVGVQVLLSLDDVAAGRGDEGGHRRDDAPPVGAAEREYQTLIGHRSTIGDQRSHGGYDHPGLVRNLLCIDVCTTQCRISRPDPELRHQFPFPARQVFGAAGYELDVVARQEMI